ncbi:MAG: DUF1924 domain-containing protein [Spirochaetota bacterium]|nr:DUF1924 domain-containing protein [Spirochaetota bacterium]
MKKIFILLCLIITGTAFSLSSEVSDYLSLLKSEAEKENPGFSGFSAERGNKIFISSHVNDKGKKVSCTTCHGNDLSKTGKDFRTGKIIKPLAPSANSKRLTNVRDIKKWLKRNFKDVYMREGSATEKGDVLTYLLNK